MISQSEKTNPISEKPKMNVNLFATKDYENEPPSGSNKTNPNKPNFTTLYLGRKIFAFPDKVSAIKRRK